MQVTIVSGFTGDSWTGELDEFQIVPGQNEGDSLLDTLFRFFNRVDPEDNERLERIGYTLPSLSAGDFIAIKSQFREEPQGFVIASLGFEQIKSFGPLGFTR